MVWFFVHILQVLCLWKIVYPQFFFLSRFIFWYQFLLFELQIWFRMLIFWLIDWLIDYNFVYQRYLATLLILVIDVLTSPERKCNIHVYNTALQPIHPREIILTSYFLTHAGYLFCNWHSLNTNFYGTIFVGMPGSFDSSQINACVVARAVPWYLALKSHPKDHQQKLTY